jgi:hypothetical protein
MLQVASPARGDDKPALQPIEKTKKKIRQNQPKKAMWLNVRHRIVQHASVMVVIAMAVAYK